MQSGKGEAGKPQDSNFKIKALGDADVSVRESYLRARENERQWRELAAFAFAAVLTHLAPRRRGSSAAGVSA